MHESEENLALNDTERQQVVDVLESILATEKFDAAPQMSAFLRYVVEQSAAGLQHRIKAFTVAVDALGKPETFDPQNDPVVRVLAGRLRASLTAYNNDHPDAPLKIKMIPGSYVPIFESQQESDNTFSINNLEQKSTKLSSDEKNFNNSESISITSIDEDSTAQNAVLVNDNSESLIASAESFSHDSTKRETEQPYTNNNALGFLGALSRMLSTIPTSALAGILGVAVLAAILVQNKGSQQSEDPDLQAALPDNAELQRSKPALPAVYISAVDEGNKLENSLHALISGVISENEQVRVYRILDEKKKSKFWPEEHILSISSLDLPDENRISIQLIKATSGRIVHSQSVSLNKNASEQITHDEMKRLIEAARDIVSEDGPLADKEFVKTLPIQ